MHRAAEVIKIIIKKLIKYVISITNTFHLNDLCRILFLDKKGELERFYLTFGTKLVIMLSGTI